MNQSPHGIPFLADFHDGFNPFDGGIETRKNALPPEECSSTRFIKITRELNPKFKIMTRHQSAVTEARGHRGRRLNPHTGAVGFLGGGTRSSKLDDLVLLARDRLLREKPCGNYKCPHFVDPAIAREILHSVAVRGTPAAEKLLAEVMENLALDLAEGAKGHALSVRELKSRVRRLVFI